MARLSASLCETKKFTNSSQVDQVAYSPDEQILIVSFKTGGLYLYAGVPKGVVLELLDAESVGSFLSHRIIPIYRCVNLSFLPSWYQSAEESTRQ